MSFQALEAVEKRLASYDGYSRINFKDAREFLLLCRELQARRSQDVHKYGRIVLDAFSSKFAEEERLLVQEQVLVAACDVGAAADARRELAKLQKRWPGSLRVRKLEGMVLEAEGKAEAAAELYKEMFEEDASQTGAAKRQVALLRGQGKTAQAIAAMCAYLDTFQGDAEAWGVLGAMYAEQGALDESIFALEECLMHSPASVPRLLAVAEARYTRALAGRATKDEDVEYARRYFAQVVELTRGQHVRALYGLCAALAKAGSKGESEAGSLAAQALVERYLSDSPDLVDAVKGTMRKMGLAR
ncbi:unnamed protein product [Pedinophyceae sp. YPF-701]|nr:unnamed protein product [Pedinophyceae sp. YPF-701]